MNYEKLNDNELNFEVARHSFDAGWLDRHYGKEGMVPDYCNNPSDAWSIIIENKINIDHRESIKAGPMARASGNKEIYFVDKNPLRAAMIVFLMIKDAGK